MGSLLGMLSYAVLFVVGQQTRQRRRWDRRLMQNGVYSKKINAQELIIAFLNAEFSGAERHVRRLEKVKLLEKK